MRDLLRNMSERKYVLRHIETKHCHCENKPVDFFQRKLLNMKSSTNIIYHFVNINCSILYIVNNVYGRQEGRAENCDIKTDRVLWQEHIKAWLCN